MSKDDKKNLKNKLQEEKTITESSLKNVEDDKTVVEPKKKLSDIEDEKTVVQDEDRTILERHFRPKFDETIKTDVLKGGSDNDKTVVDRTIHEEDKTIIEEDKTVRDTGGIVSEQTFKTFKDWNVVKEFPAEGGEADIYLLRKGDEFRVLKLYRRGMEPKPEVLKKIKELTENLNEHVIKLYEYGKDPNTGRWYELLEFAKYGNLKQFLKKVKLTKPLLKRIIYEINEGLKALHDANIIHRDLKPSNLLVRSVKPLDIAFSDFGISSIIDDDKSKKMTTVKGTPIYSAPEAFTGVMGKSADYWSLGMIILDLVDKNPLKGLNMQNIMYQLTVKNIPIPEHLDDDLKLLLKGLLTRDPKKRWGYEEVRRWLLGDRDIPVYYENEIDKTLLKNPYRFAGKDYFSLKDLAKAFLESPEKFELAEKHIARGKIISWLENNKDLDTASKVEQIVNQSDFPDEMVIKFAYEYGDIPEFRVYGIKLDPKIIAKILYKHLKREKLTEAEKRVLKNIDRLAHLYELAVKSNKKLYNPKFHDFLVNLSKFVDIHKPSTIKKFLNWLRFSIEFLKNKDAIKPNDFVSIFEPADEIPKLPKGIITHTDIDKLKKYKKNYYIPRLIFDKDWDTEMYNQIIDFIKGVPNNLLPIEDLQEVIMDYILPAEFDVIEDLPLDDYLKVVDYFYRHKEGNRFIPVEKYEELVKKYLLPEELKTRSWALDEYDRIVDFIDGHKDSLIPKEKISEKDLKVKLTIDNYDDFIDAQKLIFSAAKRGNKHDLELAIKLGALINQRDEKGNTPLHWAAKDGHFEAVKYLVEHGAEINAKNKRGDTPLGLAFPLHFKVVRYLIKKGGKGVKKTLYQLLGLTAGGGLIFAILYLIWKPLAFFYLVPYSLILLLMAMAVIELILINRKLTFIFTLGLLILVAGLIFLLSDKTLGIITSIIGGIILIGTIVYTIIKGSE